MIELRVSWGDNPRLRRAVLMGIGLVVLVWLAYIVRDIWLPLSIAFLIAPALDPLVDKMEARG